MSSYKISDTFFAFCHTINAFRDVFNERLPSKPIWSPAPKTASVTLHIRFINLDFSSSLAFVK